MEEGRRLGEMCSSDVCGVILVASCSLSLLVFIFWGLGALEVTNASKQPLAQTELLKFMFVVESSERFIVTQTVHWLVCLVAGPAQ